MKGKRKFIVTLVALAIFLTIMLSHPATNPEELGIGIGAIVFGFAFPNAAEHLNFGAKK